MVGENAVSGDNGDIGGENGELGPYLEMRSFLILRSALWIAGSKRKARQLKKPGIKEVRAGEGA